MFLVSAGVVEIRFCTSFVWFLVLLFAILLAAATRNSGFTADVFDYNVLFIYFTLRSEGLRIGWYFVVCVRITYYI